LRGDSKTALAWAIKGNFRSDYALNAATVYTMQGAVFGTMVADSEFLTSEQNWRTDRLSRRVAGDTWYSMTQQLGLKDPRLIGLPEVGLDMRKILALCDPRKEFDSDAEFAMYWGEIRREIDRQHRPQ
jgi:hypothetical protein